MPWLKITGIDVPIKRKEQVRISGGEGNKGKHEEANKVKLGVMGWPNVSGEGADGTEEGERKCMEEEEEKRFTHFLK